MNSPYVPHIFGDEVKRRLTLGRAWLTAGVACSIAWSTSDVCILYGGDEYFIRGTDQDGQSRAPCISVRCDDSVDEAIARVYRFSSILGWFLGGYVDVHGYISGTHPILYGGRFTIPAGVVAGDKSFSCNHMPIIEHENARKALAFWREGKRLEGIHASYAFLSFYKVIESQFTSGRAKADWIGSKLDSLNPDAAKRVAELRASGTDVNRHLFESCRCAVAHAYLDGEIVDPDIPADRRRLSADLEIIHDLARTYISDELKIPTASFLYKTRNRLAPWFGLLTPAALELLKSASAIKSPVGLEGRRVSAGLWPDGPVDGLEAMTSHVDRIENGVVRLVLMSERKTVVLVFLLDFPAGRAHAVIDMGGLLSRYAQVDERDVRAHASFFYSVFANRTAELTIEGLEPVDCEVVIPVNMYMRGSIEEAIAGEVEKFYARKGDAEDSESKNPSDRTSD